MIIWRVERKMGNTKDINDIIRVKQGCPLSPTLFWLYSWIRGSYCNTYGQGKWLPYLWHLHWYFIVWSYHCSSISYRNKSQKQLDNLDTYLHGKMTKMLHNGHQKKMLLCLNKGLLVNPSKTKIMVLTCLKRRHLVTYKKPDGLVV